VVVADDEGRFLEANPKACQMFGRAAAQIVGRRVYDFVDPAEVAPTRGRWDSFRAQKTQVGEFPLVRPDGSRRLLRYHAVADFAPGMHASFLEDVTDARASEAARQSAEADRDRIFELSTDLLCIVDSARRLRRVNRAWTAVLGYPERELLGRDYLELVHPEDTDRLLAARQQVIERGDVRGHHSRWRHRDGSYRWLSWSSSGYDGEHYAVGRDVTEELQARRALEASEDRFRTVADGLPLIIWMGDARGGSIYFNRHFYQYTGLEPPAEGERDQRDTIELIHPEDAARIGPLLRERREQGLEVEVTYRLRRYDGVYRWHLARSLPIRDASDRVVWRVGAATDIEDQRQAIENLKNERVLRERFVAALSHDLRSPLHAVNMSAQLILKRPDHAEAAQTQAARIVRNVGHADQLIQNLLDASRITAGEPMAIQRSDCDLYQLVRDVIDDQSTIFGDRFELDALPGLGAACDRAAIRRTLENLIGNAIKYGNPHTRVRVSVQKRDGEVCLSVHNQGHPIPDDEQAKIFQPYHRAQPRSGDGPRGWGLGLTLVRGIAEAHGGSVRVESSAESGTTFTVTLATPR
jgi:PAS domain S-box-containing protein